VKSWSLRRKRRVSTGCVFSLHLSALSLRTYGIAISAFDPDPNILTSNPTKILALGPIVPEIDLASLDSLHLATVDKTLFSMLTPQVIAILRSRPTVDSIVLFGIEVGRSLSFLPTSLSTIYRRHFLPVPHMCPPNSSRPTLPSQTLHHIHPRRWSLLHQRL